MRSYNLAIHPLGGYLQPGISLNIFVLFVFFVDQMIFPELLFVQAIKYL